MIGAQTSTIGLRQGSPFPLLIAEVGVNSQGPFDFIIDTGAARTVLSRDLATRLGIEAVRRDQLITAHGAMSVDVGAGARLTVAEMTEDDREVTIADLAPFAAAGLVVDGVLGVDFLRRHRVTFDLPASTMSLAPGPRLGEGESLEFRLAPQKPLILLPVMVGEAGPYEFGLDTGAAVSIVSTAVADAASMAQRSAAEGRGAGGAFEMETGFSRFRVGPVEKPEMTVGIASMSDLSAAVGTQVHGLLGLDFLTDLTLTIDYPASRLSLGQDLTRPS